MYIKSTSGNTQHLACPICKNEKLNPLTNKINCANCGTTFPEAKVNTGTNREAFYDFRIKTPDYSKPAALKKWEDAQNEFINYHRFYKEKDNYEHYLREIDSVKEIYTEEFILSGKILDVGGHQGRLRYYLDESTQNELIITDPYPEVFSDLDQQPNLLKAFPQLKNPVTFIASFAEHLPLNNLQFDWVHMRSVLDHFYDPYLAIKEAYRVLKPGGKILIGLSIKEGELYGQAVIPKKTMIEKLFEKIRTGQFDTLGKVLLLQIKRRISRQNYRVKKDDHLFEWSYNNLVDLLKQSNFEKEKEHWQKPPYTNVIYISAKKASPKS
jgi:ubiquinone/menaquinone biosynthesis C-methylase UbiE